MRSQFFTRLSELFEYRRKKGHGSITLTQKRRRTHFRNNTLKLYLLGCEVTYNTDQSPRTPTKLADDPLWDLHPPSPLPVIVRATNGKGKEERKDKVKLSTVVQPDALDSFYARYAEICRTGMQALKKRDRSRKKKDKAKKKKGAS